MPPLLELAQQSALSSPLYVPSLLTRGSRANPFPLGVSSAYKPIDGRSHFHSSYPVLELTWEELLPLQWLERD